MASLNLEQLQYPIGKFKTPDEYTPEFINQCKKDIAGLPMLLSRAVNGLTIEQLNTPYRPEGWKIKQVVHHIADSHMNAYIRTKLTCTEEEPTVKPYIEQLWALTPDANDDNIKVSLQLITALHNRWSSFLTTLTFNDLDRCFIHPEHGKKFNLKWLCALYAWHGKHHTAHITHARELYHF
ncbi:MAG: hypothetical protein RIQ89_1605 [Bacteroidota bacterium]|jgi:hypothetical protein